MMYQHALVALKLGDRAAYCDLCHSLMARASQSRDATAGAWAAWACVLGESGVSLKDVLYRAWKAQQELGQEGSALAPFCETLFGAALARAGHRIAALRRVEARGEAAGDAWDWLFLGLASPHGSDRRAARAWLDRALAWMATASDLPWYQRLELELLAEQLRAALA